MPTLRLTQSISANKFHVEAALDGDGLVRQTATAEFDFHFTPQDREDLRWYLEDYLQYDADPAPTIAARIEKRLAEMGVGLFKSIFQANEDARDLWATLRDRLNNTRVEIITGVEEATALPWELLRDPKTDVPLALRADAFVRTSHQVAQHPHIPQTGSESIRILLVICRPGGSDDVPFRSVASRLIKGLSESARKAFHLEVLRPPTFAQLSRVLRDAKTAGNPYHVVHFDGHGTYEELSDADDLASIRRALSKLMLSGVRSGAHGYLLFENPAVEENLQLVDGPTLGGLLAETQVPVLVVNACRSAHAEASGSPENRIEQEESARPDVHSKVRAFGSLAQEVVDAGVAGVVAMRYNVYVVTAAQFIADLYRSLAGGQALGEAVTLGRKQLGAEPFREIAYQPRSLQDWMVPIVYEAAPVTLFQKSAQKIELKITVSADTPVPSSGQLAPEVEKRPDAGFFGRDETLLALDRAFDNQQIVLLHAYAGSGKTSTAREFARWYHLTGGIAGPVLFTSFEQYKPLAQVLNETISRVFERTLEQAGVNWLALNDEQRRYVSLEVLSQIPVLWIWDNVEPIAGFPAGGESKWSDAEQEELVDFLRAAQQTKAKFLLTSRRDEQDWLGDLPARVRVPPMPMWERVQLARAIAEKYGRRLTDVDAWIPLLRFTQGNPLTITVVVRQALRDGLKTKTQLEAFVAKLRSGEAAFEDEVSEGRDKSLGASLSYGFASAFSDVERKQLALLHFFQGFVNVNVLRRMANHAVLSAAEDRELTRDAGIALLDRAAETGLLEPLGNGFYSIHPALPWFFGGLFDQYYLAPSDSQEESLLNATRAFVEAISDMGSFYQRHYVEGNQDVIALLSWEESNLLQARQLSRAHGWWDDLTGVMQGLHTLYHHLGRRPEWVRLLDEVVPDFVDPATDGPLIGREKNWDIITQFRIDLARRARRLDEGKRLLGARVDWNRKRAESVLLILPAKLNALQFNVIRSLAVSLYDLGELQRELGQSECVAVYEESLKLVEQIGDRPTAAACAYNLGHAYRYVAALKDLDRAEHWYRRSLEQFGQHNRLGRVKCQTELGSVAYQRLIDAKAGEEPETVLISHFRDAEKFYEEALNLSPQDAVDHLAVTHHQFGTLYAEVGMLEKALTHWHYSLRYKETSGDIYGAAMTRYNIACSLVRTGRLEDAREYALAAQRNYETFDDGATSEIQRTHNLLEYIEKLLKDN
jgi:tetratricopeptide (TPR) repeat protein